MTNASLSKIILDPASDPGALKSACAELFHSFTTATAPAVEVGKTTIESLQLDTGLALSPALAAQCFLDSARTAVFARGVLNSIEEATRRFRTRPIEVVYAGTGPFAPLALLVMPHLDPGDVHFTLIDAHMAAVDSVRSLVAQLDLQEYVRTIACADATCYRHPTAIHVIVSETMQRALSREPFVAIMHNLRPQLATGGLVVPERVTIDLALIDEEQEQARQRGETATVESKQLARLLTISADGNIPDVGERSAVTIESVGLPRKWLGLLTSIEAGRGARLDSYDSGLTMPDILWDFSPVTRDVVLEFWYELGKEPGIRWRECHSHSLPAV
jgi:hypothetical protein